MMGHRERMKSGDEVDMFSPWRRVHSPKSIRNCSHRTKIRFSRRIRKAARHSLQNEVREAFGS